MNLIELAETRVLPDAVIRLGIRRLLKQRLHDEHADDHERQSRRFQALLEELRGSQVAIHTDAANQQHYELPAEFFQKVLGKHLKYSACYWAPGIDTLDQAEAAMLQRYAERAQLEDGQTILELGCGWGSLTLWMAERYPNSRIVGVSNSHRQRHFIESAIRQRGLNNVQIITCDINAFSIDIRFDRVVSIEMFEHVRNYQQLMARIAGWLKTDGKLFVHLFCHRYLMYPFTTENDADWMGRHFFTGGLMPSASTLLHFQDDLHIESQWSLGGTHYQRTAQAWLENMDKHKAEIIPLFKQTYAHRHEQWLQRWRLFFLACAELFGYRNGNEWMVAHYRFQKST